MNWQKVIDDLNAVAVVVDQLDPAIAPTVDEIAKLATITVDVKTKIEARANVSIDDVVASLTPEDPV